VVEVIVSPSVVEVIGMVVADDELVVRVDGSKLLLSKIVVDDDADCSRYCC